MAPLVRAWLPRAMLASKNRGRRLLKFEKGPRVILISRGGGEGLVLAIWGNQWSLVCTCCMQADLVTLSGLFHFSHLQGGALLGGVNALHTSFPENPLEQYRRQCELILERLELRDLLSEELRRLER